MDEAERGGNEVLVQDFNTSIQLPDQDDEAAEVVVVVDEHLSVRAADTNTNRLRTKEVTLGNFLGSVGGTSIERSVDVLDGEVGRFEELHTFKLNTSRHHRLTSQEVALTSLGTHVEAGVVRHHGVTHVHALTRSASVTSDLTEVGITTQVHHEDGIADAAIQTVGESRNVALTQILNNSQKVGTNRELLNLVAILSNGVRNTPKGILGLTTSEVVTTLGVRSLTLGNGFQQFVDENPITPTTIVIQQSQAAD